MTMTRFALGPIDDFKTFPAEVLVDGIPYWLVRGEENRYKLLMALCPHAGGEVRWTGELFFCPLHFWTFDNQSGDCLNIRDERLVRKDVELQEGILYAIGDAY